LSRQFDGTVRGLPAHLRCRRGALFDLLFRMATSRPRVLAQRGKRGEFNLKGVVGHRTAPFQKGSRPTKSHLTSGQFQVEKKMPEMTKLCSARISCSSSAELTIC